MLPFTTHLCPLRLLTLGGTNWSADIELTMLSIGSSASASVRCEGLLAGVGRLWLLFRSSAFGLAASDCFDFPDTDGAGSCVSEVFKLNVRRCRVIASAGDVAVDTRRR